MEAYFLAKSRLFCDLPKQPKKAVINTDDANGQRLQIMCEAQKLPVITYGKNASDFRLLRIEPVAQGLDVMLHYNGQAYEGCLPLYGEFQVYNVAAALCAVAAQGMPVENALSYLPKLMGVNGRMENVGLHPNGAPVFIDYAHTPDALEQVLKSLRKHCKGALHVVFGCGGDRDKGKRPLMGGVAEKHADNIIITDDNPRSEEPSGIHRAIMSGIKEKKVTLIPDRKEAIFAAVQQLSGDDILVVAGKGHEAYQIVGTQTLEFNDKAEILGAIRTL